MNHAPIVGARKNGRLIPKDTFPKLLEKVLKRHKMEKDADKDDADDADREVYVFAAADQRRIAYRKFLDDNGIPYDEISTHSYRKGSATYTASGSTAVPPIIAICLRAGWKLGGVLNTYLSLENAGDRFVGCVCALLPQLSKKFCVMPPRFPPNNADDALVQLIDKAMTGMFGKWKSHGGSFAAVLKHCLASLCYHKVCNPPYVTLRHLTPPCYVTQEWLQSFPAGHSFHRSFLAMHPQMWNTLRVAVGKLQYDGDSINCVATGIPPWCHLALKVCG